MNEEAAESPDPGPEVPRQLWRVFLAVLSFLLGLLSCFTCVFGFFFGAAAIGLGLIVRSGLSGEASKLAPSARWAKRGIVLGSIGVGIALILYVMVVFDTRARGGYHPSCRGNLKGIFVCMKMYAGEHDGACPDSLARMYPEYLSDLTELICPSSGKAPGDPTRIEEWSDYAIVPGLRETGTPADAKVLAAYEKVYTNHEPPARNELYLDGHVEVRAQEGTLLFDK